MKQEQAFEFYCERCQQKRYQPGKPRVLNQRSWFKALVDKINAFMSAYSDNDDYICERCFMEVITEPIDNA